MYKIIIENYINKMTFDTLKEYINTNYNNVSENEIKVIYYYLKNNWEDLYNEDKNILEKIKKEVSNNTYEEIVKLLSIAYKFKHK